MRNVNGSLIRLAYDAQGNATGRGTQGFYFDQGNRLQLALGIANYSYDGWGRRTRVNASSGVTRTQMYGRSGQMLYGKTSQGMSSWDTRYVVLGGKLIAESIGQSNVYVHTDALGSPVARTNAAGGLISRTRYEPYGATAAGANPGSDGSTGIGFTGHVNDAESGLVYMQQRYYDPVAGRFLSVDPVTTDTSTGSSFNRYVYGNNSPYKFKDPDGRFAQFAALATPPGLVIAAVAVAGHYLLPGREAREQALGNLISSQSSASKPSTLTPGPNAGDSIPARGPGRDFTPDERQQVNDIGNSSGCHTCGATSPGTKNDNWIPDHQPPNSQNGDGGPQRLYPHCLSCSRTQGGEARAEQSRGKTQEPKKEEPKVEK